MAHLPPSNHVTVFDNIKEALGLLISIQFPGTSEFHCYTVTVGGMEWREDL